MGINRVENTYKKNNQIIFDNNSKENFLKYNEKITVNKEFDFELINNFIKNYIKISNDTNIKDKCDFIEFNKNDFKLIELDKKLYCKHFNNIKSNFNHKLNIMNTYSRIGFKFVSMDVNKEHIPFIMVSLNYVSKNEAFYLIPITDNYNSVLKLNRSERNFLIEIKPEQLNEHFYKEFKRCFYSHIKTTLKEYKIKRNDFMALPFNIVLNYVDIACLEDY